VGYISSWLPFNTSLSIQVKSNLNETDKGKTVCSLPYNLEGGLNAICRLDEQRSVCAFSDAVWGIPYGGSGFARLMTGQGIQSPQTSTQTQSSIPAYSGSSNPNVYAPGYSVTVLADW